MGERIFEIPESPNNKDDGKDIVLNMAKILGIELIRNDIQRAHQLGKKKKSLTAKPHPVIAKFVSNKKRSEFSYV